MTFDEVLEQVIALLQREGRVTYRALKRRFGIDDDYLSDLCGEIIKAKRLAADEDGEVLVWVGNEDKGETGKRRTGEESLGSSVQSLESKPSCLHAAASRRADSCGSSRTDGERKTITALFADLKGSTALIEGLDPEEARAIIDPALQLMMDAVHRYEGYVAQALGRWHLCPVRRAACP